jgi:hypothetical protein|mmetsp:Transcript_52995/g.84276  ORF Transcript_52995/g.84276 Transcript_52995/m.84276 type:complete len:286 (+) Transcript_52995:57-914(+)
MIKDFARDYAEELANNVWKACPFRAGNRLWLVVILKGYSFVIVAGFVLACVLNSVEGKKWLSSDITGKHFSGKGDTALDECFWFVITTIHGIGFGEFLPRSGVGRFVTMLCISCGYWFPLFMLAIVLLSQLAGEKMPTLQGVISRMVCAVWPSYAVFLAMVLTLGAQAGPYVSSDHGFGWQQFDTGIYWFWQVAHRMPFGDLYPNTPFGRTLAIVGAMLGNLYMPYAFVCIAVRRYTKEQHDALMENLRNHPEDALGRGYIAPAGIGQHGMREMVMQEYSPDHVV